MSYEARKIDAQSVTFATDQSRDRIDSTTRRALLYLADPDRKARKEKGLCIACHYASPGMAGQAFTSRPCGVCGQPQSYPSTATDDLCLRCAVANALCKKCGADVLLRPRRVFTKAR